MSHPLNNQAFENSILGNTAGVVVPPTAQLSVDAQAALAAAAGGNAPAASGAATSAAVAAAREEQRRLLIAQAQARAIQAQREEAVAGERQKRMLIAQARAQAIQAAQQREEAVAAGEQRNRLLIAQARAQAIQAAQQREQAAAGEQQNRLLIAQARAQAIQAAQAQQREEDDLLVRLLLQRNQQRRDAATLSGVRGPGSASFPTAINPAGLGPGLGAATANPYANQAAAQAQRELQIMDRNALLLEETRARQGLRTLAYIHPQTGLALPASAAGSAGLAALRGLQSQQPTIDAADPQSVRQASGVESAVAVAAAAAQEAEESGDEQEELSRAKSPAQPRKRRDQEAPVAEVAPRAPLSAFNFFFASERERIEKEKRDGEGKETEEDRIGSEAFAANVQARWEALPDDQRRYFQELADRDAERQKEAIHAYHTRKMAAENAQAAEAHQSDEDAAEEEEEEVIPKGRIAKDPSAPKRPGSAFLLFSNGRRKMLKRFHPEASNAELSKMLSKLWKEAPDKTRQHYMNESRKLGKNYKFEMAQWRRKVAEEKKAQRDMVTAGQIADHPDSKPSARKAPPQNADALAHMESQGLAVQSRAVASSQLLGIVPGMDPRLLAGAEGQMIGQIPSHVGAALPQATAAPVAAESASTSGDSTDGFFPDENGEAAGLDGSGTRLESDLNDPEAPKRPMSAFLAFSNKRRKSLKKQYPYATNADLSKMLSKTWREAPDVIRDKYLKEAAVLSEQYKEAVAKWRAEKAYRERVKAIKLAEKQLKTQADAEEEMNEEPDVDANDGGDEAASDGGDPPVPSSAGAAVSGRDRGTTISSQIYELFRKNDWDALTLCNRVVDLCRIYDWKELKEATLECYAACRSRSPTDLGNVINRAEALAMWSTKVPFADMKALRDELVTDFISSLESLSTVEDDEDGASGRTKTLEVDNISIPVRLLFEAAGQDTFERIEAWGSDASSDHLSQLYNLFCDADRAGVECNNVAAKTKCMQALESRHKEQRIEDLKREREELVEATRNGEPRFSWVMPKADTESPALNAFFHSDRNGPETIVVGCGVDFARSLATRVRFHQHRTFGTRRSPEDILKLGYSAEIENTNNTGKHAAVVVTKTRDLHTAEVNEYRANMVKLRNVCTELVDLGVQVAVLGASDGDGGSNDEPVAEAAAADGEEEVSAAEAAVAEEAEAAEEEPKPEKKRPSALEAMAGRFKRRRQDQGEGEA